MNASVKFLEQVYPNQLLYDFSFACTLRFSDIAIEFGKRKSSGKTSKQPAKRNKSSKKTTFHEDLIDLQKAQLNAMKEFEIRQQDFMETIIKQQQD